MFQQAMGQCRGPDLNWGLLDFQSSALPTELPRLTWGYFSVFSRCVNGGFREMIGPPRCVIILAMITLDPRTKME
jgi:hypothetical protein